MMNDLLYFGLMALVLIFILVALVRSAARYKNYYASADKMPKPLAGTAKSARSQRAQEIWNRLNPRFYLDDDPTEPMPDKKLRKQVKQR